MANWLKTSCSVTDWWGAEPRCLCCHMKKRNTLVVQALFTHRSYINFLPKLRIKKKKDKSMLVALTNMIISYSNICSIENILVLVYVQCALFTADRCIWVTLDHRFLILFLFCRLSVQVQPDVSECLQLLSMSHIIRFLSGSGRLSGRFSVVVWFRGATVLFPFPSRPHTAKFEVVSCTYMTNLTLQSDLNDFFAGVYQWKFADRIQALSRRLRPWYTYNYYS